MTLQKLIAGIIKEARIEAGLTQVQLAEKAGVTQVYVSQIEAGTKNLSLQQTESILTAANAKLLIDWEILTK